MQMAGDFLKKTIYKNQSNDNIATVNMIHISMASPCTIEGPLAVPIPIKKSC